MKNKSFFFVLFLFVFCQLSQAQYKASALNFRVNLKNVKSYEFFVAGKSVYKATSNGHIIFWVYGTPQIDLKIVETLLDGTQRNSEQIIPLKQYVNSNGWVNQFYQRIKREKEIGKWTLGHLAIIGSKYLTRINVYNEDGRTFFDRYDLENNEGDEITKYDFKIGDNKYVLIKSLNSRSDDYCPMVNPSGTKLYFTSKRGSRFGNSGKDDLYTVNLYDGGIGKAQLLPEPVNSNDNDGASTFTGDGQTLVFTRCSLSNGFGSCDLYTSSLNGETWGIPKNMGANINSKSWDSQPSISADGSKLVFASLRKGGYGGSDLYISHKNKNGVWSMPQNLGGIINTSSEDKSPFLAPDGQTLYYSSSGYGGFGKADMFKSVLINNEWSKPINMGNIINTPYDDLYFSTSASGEYAFFASKNVPSITIRPREPFICIELSKLFKNEQVN